MPENGAFRGNWKEAARGDKIRSFMDLSSASELIQLSYGDSFLFSLHHKELGRGDDGLVSQDSSFDL